MKPRKSWSFVSLMAICALFLAQCGPAATPALPTAAPTTAGEATTAPEATEATEATTAPEATEPAPAEDYANAARNETVILDIDGGRVVDPENWNPFVPGNRRDHGYHQAMIEPLFILNYETGEIEPWLGESFTANDTQDVWTLKVRDGGLGRERDEG